MSAGIQGVARGPAAHEHWWAPQAAAEPTKRVGRRGAPAAATDEAARWAWTGGILSFVPAHTSGQGS